MQVHVPRHSQLQERYCLICSSDVCGETFGRSFLWLNYKTYKFNSATNVLRAKKTVVFHKQLITFLGYLYPLGYLQPLTWLSSVTKVKYSTFQFPHLSCNIYLDFLFSTPWLSSSSHNNRVHLLTGKPIYVQTTRPLLSDERHLILVLDLLKVNAS